MRITFFIESQRSGGKEKQLVELVKGLYGLTDIVCEVVLMDRDVFYTDLFDIDVKVHFIKSRFPKDPMVIKALYDICSLSRPDIIHAWGFPMVLYSWPVSRLMGAKIINGAIRFAGPIKPFSELWWYLKLTTPISDMIIANSQAGLKLCGNSKSHKLRCISNGVSSGHLVETSLAEVKNELCIEGSKVIGMVANFHPRKDYETPIRAVSELLRRGMDIVFLAVGDGVGLNEAKSLVSDEYRKRFFFLGKQKDVRRYVEIFDIGVLSTNAKVHAEGISNAIMEYMVMEKPVIATDSGGNRELIDNGRTGYLVPPFSSRDMVDKMVKLLNNKELRLSMGHQGKRRVIEEFSTEKMIGQYFELYQSLTKS